MSYAIVKTGGKQYRVEQGQSLLVERLPVDDGAKVELQPLLYVDGSDVIDRSEDLAKVTIEAQVVAHERGPKLRVVKFKPKRGYKRRNGHRQELTRLEITGIKLGSRAKRTASGSKRGPAPVAADAPAAQAPEAGRAEVADAGAKVAAEEPKAPRKPRARKPPGTAPAPEGAIPQSPDNSASEAEDGS